MYRLPRTWSRSHPLLGTSRARLRVEELEARALPSNAPLAPAFQPVESTRTNVTLDRAQDLHALTVGGQLAVAGTIGAGPAGAADVKFYCFTLAQPAQVHLETLDRPNGLHLAATLSLYNTNPQVADPNSPNQITDTQDILGNHLLAQQDGAGHRGFATIDQTLGAGTYYIAVSGSGNDYFNPFLVGSGYAGGTGDYQVFLTAADAGIGPDDGPAILAASAVGIDGALLAGIPLTRDAVSPPDGSASASPTPAAQLSASPQLLRLELSASVDPSSLAADADVVLNYSPTTDFSDPSVTRQISVQTTFIDAPGEVKELQLTPAAPLAPGYYQVVVQGNQMANALVVTSLDGSTLLGQNADNPNGQDYSFTFHVAGSEGVVPAAGATDPIASADDTPATARDLGSLAGVGRLQVTGAVGNDPTDPNAFNPNAVELYHFRVEGTGNYAFAAEVFAQRIGSTLDPALSLFKPRASDGQLEFVIGNQDTTNAVAATDGSTPASKDAALYAGLTAGDYYLAVSSGRDVPNPTNGHPQGTGVFDPNVSHSGGAGNSTGPYVLNLQVERALYPPHVVATSVSEGSTLAAPPTTLTVQFDRPVNLQQSAFAANTPFGAGPLPSVFIVDAAGKTFGPSFVSYDPAANAAMLVMMDALPNGAYTLHLSGAAGLADLGGNPLVGNDASGDYFVHFRVNGPPRGTAGDPTTWTSAANSLSKPQVLGALFPTELKKGVSLTRAAGATTDTAAYYQFTVLALDNYSFRIAKFAGQSPALALFSDGVPLPLRAQRDGSESSYLLPGTYVLAVTWPGKAALETYQLILSASQGSEAATPLTSGPTPALGLRLVSDALPAADPAPTPPVAPLIDALPPSTPASTDPVAVVPPASSTNPSVASGVGKGIVTVSLPLQAPVSVTVTTAAGPAGPVAVAVPVSSLAVNLPAPGVVISPADAGGVAPQLALALSDGPFGGLRAREANLGSPAEAPGVFAGASSYLAAVAIVVPAPTVGSSSDLAAVSDGTPTAPEVGRFGGFVQSESWGLPAALPAVVTADVAWLSIQPAAIARVLTRGSIELVEGFDVWLEALNTPQPTPRAVATLQQPIIAAPVEVAVIDSQAAAAPATPVASVSVLESLANRPFWWGATTVLSFVWGALNGHKWLVARRGRPLSLRGKDGEGLTRANGTSFDY